MEIDPGMPQVPKQVAPTQPPIQQRPSILPPPQSYGSQIQRTVPQYANPTIIQSTPHSAFTHPQVPKQQEVQKPLPPPQKLQPQPTRPQIPQIARPPINPQSAILQPSQTTPQAPDSSNKLKINLFNTSTSFSPSRPQPLNKDIRDALSLKPSSPIKSSSCPAQPSAPQAVSVRPTQSAFSRPTQPPVQIPSMNSQRAREAFSPVKRVQPMQQNVQNEGNVQAQPQRQGYEESKNSLQSPCKSQTELQIDNKVQEECKAEDQQKEQHKNQDNEETKNQSIQQENGHDEEMKSTEIQQQKTEPEKPNDQVKEQNNNQKAEEEKAQAVNENREAQKTQTEEHVHNAQQEVQNNVMDSYQMAMRMDQMEETETPEVPVEKPQASSSQSIVDKLSTYDCFYKMKAMSIYKVTEEGELTKLYSLRDLFLPKNVFTSDQVVYVIGGSKDLNVTQTVNVCLEIDFKNTVIRPIEKTPMTETRASFGCTISKDQSKIYVTGGYKNGNEVFNKCEMYNRTENKWYPLPDLSKAKCSSGLCEFTSNGKTWLYCLGGLWRGTNSKEVSLLDEIERIELGEGMANGWEVLPLTLPEKICDIGISQLNEKTIMIYGGWSINSLNGVHYFEPESERMTIKSQNDEDEKLAKPDFFLVNGCVGKSKDGKVLISGHHYLHKFDPATKKFLALGAE